MPSFTARKYFVLGLSTTRLIVSASWFVRIAARHTEIIHTDYCGRKTMKQIGCHWLQHFLLVGEFVIAIL